MYVSEDSMWRVLCKFFWKLNRTIDKEGGGENLSVRGSSRRRTGDKHGPCSDEMGRSGLLDASDATGPTSAERGRRSGTCVRSGAACPLRRDASRRDESQDRRSRGGVGARLDSQPVDQVSTMSLAVGSYSAEAHASVTRSHVLRS